MRHDNIISNLIFITVAIGLLVLISYAFLNFRANDKLCESKLPLIDSGNVWYEYPPKLEPGYVNCCFSYYKDHMKQKECQVFLKGDSE